LESVAGENRYNRMNRMPFRILACLLLTAAWTCEQQNTMPQQSTQASATSPAPAPTASPVMQPTGAIQQPATEVAQQDTPITFQSKVNLVLVPVVVRSNKTGKPVGNLEKEDFLLYDKGKLQTISKFTVEKAGARPVSAMPEIERSAEEKMEQPNAPQIIVADHFVAYFFDDIHLSFGDLVQARNAAMKHLNEAIGPKDRAALYTTSGQVQVDFTDDRDMLRAGLSRIRPTPIARNSVQGCPDISYYQGDLIENRNDALALSTAVTETLVCANLEGPPPDIQTATTMAKGAARQAVAGGEQETRVALLTLKDLIRRMSAMPGQRTIVMISPGFYRMTDQRQDETEVIDRAIKANVTISTLDARGLYTDTPDISKRVVAIQAEVRKQQMAREAMRADSDILAELADGTGGRFFENNNDLAQGLNDLAETPSVYYILGFSPQNLKLDGSYHDLKVKLKTPAGLTSKGRRGYYAPRHLSSADDEAKEEISQALFSREEMRDIPLEMHTQFFMAGPSDGRLAVVSRFDIRKLKYRRIDGRNGDDLVLVAGLFDRNGNFVQSVSKKITMRLKDETLTGGKLNAGVSVRSDFKVVPGTYVIRLVLRDAEGQMMAAQNGAVEIP
jgi:VWFA-related protein